MNEGEGFGGARAAGVETCMAMSKDSPFRSLLVIDWRRHSLRALSD